MGIARVETELRILRLRWYQDMIRHPKSYEQLLTVILSSLPGTKDTSSHPWYLQVVDDLAYCEQCDDIAWISECIDTSHTFFLLGTLEKLQKTLSTLILLIYGQKSFQTLFLLHDLGQLW